MKVGQQIKIRMEQLGVSVQELAKRVGVSGQAVRHWIAGRSFPGKRHAPALERALSFSLDYTEGVSKRDGRQSAMSAIERGDVELMILISKLKPELRVALHRLVEACAEAGPVQSFSEKVKTPPKDSFFKRGDEIVKRSKKRASS